MVIKHTQKLTFGLTDLLSCPSKHLANPQLPAREVFTIGMFLAFLQIIDGWFTNLGINQFGVDMEGNPLLHSLMVQFGHVPTLTIVKLVSILLIIMITVYSKRVPWIKHALYGVTGVYLIGAIIPWTYILFVQPALA